MNKIKIGIIGVGNCASSLIQGINYYSKVHQQDAIGLMNWDIGGYKPYDIEVVLAFDIDTRKVNKDISEAIFEKPNCTITFNNEVPKSGYRVQMGKILDGVSEHMLNYEDDYTFVLSHQPEPSKEQIIQLMRESGVEILLNYLPVGSEEATKFYAECALEANVAFINNIPVLIASDPEWAQKYKDKNIPLIGDDIKAQIGATITHRSLTDLFKMRGVKLDRTYQLNVGGNTDFLNMLNHDRNFTKKKSKTEAVQSVAMERLNDRNIHVGPSDYVPWHNDKKVAFIRMEGRIFGDVPIDLELRLSVEDSPNSAGVAIDLIRTCKIALDRNIGGVIHEPSSFFCKHPSNQVTDAVAYANLQKFIYS